MGIKIFFDLDFARGAICHQVLFVLRAQIEADMH